MSRRPMERLSINLNFIYSTVNKFAHSKHLLNGLLTITKTALSLDEISDSVPVYLPLLHVLVARNSFSIFFVQVIIWYEHGI